MYKVTYQYPNPVLGNGRMWTTALSPGYPGTSKRRSALNMSYNEALRVVESIRAANYWIDIIIIPVRSSFFIGQNICTK